MPNHTQRFLNIHCIERWGRPRDMSGPHDPEKEGPIRQVTIQKLKASGRTLETRQQSMSRLHASQRDPLAENFRLAVREMMSKDEIKELIEWRFTKELRGELPRMIIHECFASARGRSWEDNVAKVKGQPMPHYPSDDLFAGWTTDEKQVF